MADRNAKVQERIREELERNPGATTGELQAVAQSVESSLGQLSLRQFNAGFVLPLKRRLGVSAKAASGKPAAKPRRRGPGRKKAAGSAAPARRGRPPAAAAATRAAASAPAAAPAAAPTAALDRDRIRSTLLKFAQDISGAESRTEIVAVLSNIDRYVDQIAAPGA